MQKQKPSRVACLWLFFVASAVGCGSSGTTVTPAQIDAFVGDWKFDSELLTADCGALLPGLHQDLTGMTLTLARASGADIMLTLSATCKVLFTVGGTTATAKAQQTCTLAVGPAGMQDIAVMSWTLTTQDGVTMTTAQAGTAAQGLCMVSGSGMLTKQ